MKIIETFEFYIGTNFEEDTTVYKHTIDKELKELIEKILGTDINNSFFTKENKDGNCEIIPINYSDYALLYSIFETEDLIPVVTEKSYEKWWID